jgi:hypothetical protein
MFPTRTPIRKLSLVLVAAVAAAACDKDPTGTIDPNFSRGAPQDLHCPDHRTSVKIEVPGGWSFGTDGPYVAMVTVEDTRTGDLIEVQVTIDGGTVSFASSEAELESASFCIKGGPNHTGALSGTSGNTNGIPNRGGNAPNVSYVTLGSVTSVEGGDVVACGQGLQVSGGFEIFEATIEMGQTSGTFQFYYRGINQPDWFELYYEGVRVFDVVGGTQANNPIYAPLFQPGGRFDGASGTDPVDNRTVNVDYGDATSTSTKITIRVTGSEEGTVWQATVNCPGN